MESATLPRASLVTFPRSDRSPRATWLMTVEQLGDAALEIVVGFLVAGGFGDFGDGAIEVVGDVAEFVAGVNFGAGASVAGGEALGEFRELLDRGQERAAEPPGEEQRHADG